MQAFDDSEPEAEVEADDLNQEPLTMQQTVYAGVRKALHRHVFMFEAQGVGAQVRRIELKPF